MKKNEFNEIFRDYVRQNLSPRPQERALIQKLYESFKNLLGEENCHQIGSYPRLTSITPVHDLDILFKVSDWNEYASDPTDALNSLKRNIENSYSNPTTYDIIVSLQSHSITILFSNGDEEIFSVDIVPGYVYRINEFGKITYMVPEIVNTRHRKRKLLYESTSRGEHEMKWIVSDPLGYIEVAEKVDNRNSDFRKTVKFIKAWLASCKEIDEDFKLKSFHIEQIVTQYFIENDDLEIFDAVFRFFCELNDFILRPMIPDRADEDRYIDDYIDSLTKNDRQKIRQARDLFLIKLEDFTEDSSIEELLTSGFYKRASGSEQFLFDSHIPMLIENDINLRIGGRVLARKGGFLETFLDKVGLIKVDRQIKFIILGNKPDADLFKWKVKNDNNSQQPRGEITDHSTLRDPEHTRYIGSHFVECYAIKNGVCIARARQNVVLNKY